MPVIWRLMGRWRIYALSGAVMLSMLAAAGWFALQLHVTESPALTPAAKAFFAGFEILMAVVILIGVGAAVSIEQTIIGQMTQLRAEVTELQKEILVIDGALKTHEAGKEP